MEEENKEIENKIIEETQETTTTSENTLCQTSAGNHILRVSSLFKQFGHKKVVRGVEFSMTQGEVLGLLGPNGCGKTTLIKMINGLLTPSCGSITINSYAPGVETKKIVSYLPDNNCHYQPIM